MSSLPLKGITVIDLSRLIPGPFCSLILADLGARVIKIEDPRQGDYLRTIPPHVDEKGGALFYALNRNKESMVLDITKPEGQDILLRLLRKVDVLLESYRPGVLAKMGLSLSRLRKANPKLVMASITGYGQTGPYREKAGHDLNYLSLSGMLPGKEPPPVQLADFVGGGLWGALAVVSAILRRQTTKKGTHLDISMTDGMAFLGIGNLLMQQLGIGQNILSGILARYRVYETADGEWVALAALETKFWNRFCDLIQQADWKDSESQLYVDSDRVIHDELSRLFHSHPLSHWKTWAAKYDICLTPVHTPEGVLKSETFMERKFFHRTRKENQELIFPTVPIRWDGPQAKYKEPRAKGADTNKILKALGYKDKAMKELKKKGVMG